MDAAPTSEQPGTEQERTELHLAELSNAMVPLSRTSLTRPEQKMAEVGEHGRLRDLRMYFQYQHEAEFVGAVERITGRKVRGFVSGIDTRQDIGTELFYLEPLS